jgi:ribose 5-phosphate isomerase A
MPSEMSPIDKAKYVAARRAVEYVEDGMRVGLGTGSTAAWMVRCLAEMVRNEGMMITTVATSSRTAELARTVGLDVRPLDEVRWLDLTIDGADEFDPNLNLIKGGGGALLHEKIVATASDQMVVIADRSKYVDRLGGFPLPVEIVPFGWQTTKALVEEMLTNVEVMGRSVELRRNGPDPFRTDEGNLILDLRLRRISNPAQLSLILNQIPGVVENGLFLDICDVAIIGNSDGTVELRDGHDGSIEHERVDLVDGDNLFVDVVD